MKVGLYFHAGSKNHGCEALVRSTVKILGGKDCTLYSIRQQDDLAYHLDECCIVEKNWLPRRNFFSWIFLIVFGKIGWIREEEKQHYYTLHNSADVMLSIGGDNYCYSGQPRQLAYLNKKLKEKGKKTVLWGCSIEPALLKNQNIVEDLKRYDRITVRESITREALAYAGVNENVRQYADPAFCLEQICLPLPEKFEEGNTIGINVSPLICRYEKKNGAVLENYRNLIRYIIQETDNHIAFIPHVVVEGNDDREVLSQLYHEFESTGRVILIDDMGCRELKGVISRCRLFVGARTHATIAAYSTCVPTLVVGYSVKARGIAKDLFGTEEHYVLPVQNLKEPKDLVKEFEWLLTHEEEIRDQLKETIPDYIESAMTAGCELKEIV